MAKPKPTNNKLADASWDPHLNFELSRLEDFNLGLGDFEGFNLGDFEGFNLGLGEGFNLGLGEGFNLGLGEGFNLGLGDFEGVFEVPELDEGQQSKGLL